MAGLPHADAPPGAERRLSGPPRPEVFLNSCFRKNERTAQQDGKVGKAVVRQADPEASW